MEISSTVRQALQRATNLAVFTQQLITPQSREADGIKELLTAAACNLGFELHGSILLLIGQGYPGGGLALLRPSHDAMLRAFWLYLIATEEEAVALAKGEVQFRSSGELAILLEREFEGTGGSGRFKLPKGLRDQLHGFTHSGMEQLQHRFGASMNLGAHYRDQTLLQAIVESCRHAAFTAVVFFNLLGQPDLGDKVINKMNLELAPEEQS